MRKLIFEGICCCDIEVAIASAMTELVDERENERAGSPYIERMLLRKLPLTCPYVCQIRNNERLNLDSL